MLDKHNVLMIFVLAVLVIFSFWLQFVLLETPSVARVSLEENDPDYYIENFTSFGVDEDGSRYELEAERLVHYPIDNKALLNKPYITQFDAKGAATHIYANSGWLFNQGTEVLLTDNVRVIQGQGATAGGAATTQRMRIKLKQKAKK